MSYYVKKMRKQLYNIINEILTDPNNIVNDTTWYISDKDLKKMEEVILQEGMNVKRLTNELEMLRLELDRNKMTLRKVS